ncbi:MAG: hypothetical protein E6K54_01965 [Gammaproteobacteria bacterium]|nr:MAG: hypothetical protein E6K54_01965 [Gammaproteobacteria bacterium]
MSKSTKLTLEKINQGKNKLEYFENIKVLWMPISVGQDYHELGKLKESINLIIKNLKNITLINIIIVDLPQKYHLAIKNNKSPDEMVYQARINGIIWKQCYENLIKTRFKNIKVIFSTWSNWLTHDRYNQARNYIENLYRDKENLFYKSIEDDVLEFERRYFNREGRQFKELEKGFCRECIKEECAVLAIWHQAHVSPNSSCIFYPKKIPAALSYIKQNFTDFLSISARFPSKLNVNKFLLFQSKRKSLDESLNSCNFKKLRKTSC